MQNTFTNATANFNNLVAYGFIKENNEYKYSTNILNNRFTLFITIDKDSNLKTQMIDNAFNEEYTAHLHPLASGEFVQKLQNIYESILEDIKAKCFNSEIFNTTQSKDIINYIKNKYNNELEYLWKKFPDNAIFRRTDTKKWYGLILTIPKNKIGLNGNEKVEILVLRHPADKISNIINNTSIFTGYHMNKKHWITILLDSTLSIENIKNLIDESFSLAV